MTSPPGKNAKRGNLRAEPAEPGGAAEDGGAEGWESLAGEAAGALGQNSALEDSMREAGEAAEGAASTAASAAESTAAGAARRENADAADASAAGESAAQLAALEAEHAQLLDRHLRLQADFDNHRKRTSRQRSEAQAAGLEKLARDLLGGLDDLERAQQFAAQPDGKLADMLQGVELVRRELLGALGRHGLCEIEALGASFDPKVHEAMAQAVHPDASPGQVLEVLQRGYRLGGRLLRPARVVVAKAPEAPAAQSDGDSPGGDGESANGDGESAVGR